VRRTRAVTAGSSGRTPLPADYAFGAAVAVFLILGALWLGRPDSPLAQRKAALEACRAEVLGVRTGTIERIREWERGALQYYVVVGRDASGGPWIAACEKESGRVVQTAGLKDP